jgi:hypothetical protein
LQYQIQQADQQYLKLRRNKQPVVAPLDDNDPMRSLRTTSMGTIKKPRKLCRRAPTNLSGRIMEGVDQHPLFSFPERKKPKGAVLLKEPGSPLPAASQAKSSQPKRRRDSQRKKEPKNEPKTEKEKDKDIVKLEAVDDDTAARPARKRRNTKDESPKSPLFTPPTTPSSTPKLSEKKKKTLKTRDFDIDNVVIPFGMGSACTIPVIQYKEILTPKWRSVQAPDFKSAQKRKPAASPACSPDVSPHPSPLPSPSTSPVDPQPLAMSQTIQLQLPPFKKRSPSGTNLNGSANGVAEIRREDPPPARFSVLEEHDHAEQPAPNGDSSDEDTSDEAFAHRHLKQEVSERQRYLLPKKKKADTAGDSAITDLFVTTEDLLSSYSPNPTGSLLNNELFSHANSEEEEEADEADSPESPRSGSLSLKKEKLKEKFARIRSSYGVSEESASPTKQQVRSFSAPSSSSKRSRLLSGNESDESSESEGSAASDDGSDSKQEEEEEYTEYHKRKKRLKPKPATTRSERARARAEAAAAKAAAQRAKRAALKAAKQALEAAEGTKVASPESDASEQHAEQQEAEYSEAEEQFSTELEWDSQRSTEDKWWWDSALSWEVIPPCANSEEGGSLKIKIRRKNQAPIAQQNSAPPDDTPTPPVDTQSLASENDALTSATPPAQVEDLVSDDAPLETEGLPQYSEVRSDSLSVPPELADEQDHGQHIANAAPDISHAEEHRTGAAEPASEVPPTNEATLQDAAVVQPVEPLLEDPPQFKEPVPESPPSAELPHDDSEEAITLLEVEPFFHEDTAIPKMETEAQPDEASTQPPQQQTHKAIYIQTNARQDNNTPMDVDAALAHTIATTATNSPLPPGISAIDITDTPTEIDLQPPPQHTDIYSYSETYTYTHENPTDTNPQDNSPDAYSSPPTLIASPDDDIILLSPLRTDYTEEEYTPSSFPTTTSTMTTDDNLVFHTPDTPS